MYRTLFVLSFALCLFAYNYAGAYIEERFFCTVEQNTISVSIATGTKNCFGYMEQLTAGLEEVDKDITQAETYITQGDDVSYRQIVKLDLLDKRDDLENLRDQFDLAISDYEHELFVKVKGVVGYYLMPKRQQVIEKLGKADNLLVRLKILGDTENYHFVVEQIELLQQQLILLDRIRYAYSFAELIAPLKIYINGGGFDINSPSPIL